MKRLFAICLLLAMQCSVFVSTLTAQQRRPIDNRHPLWMIHVDVWNAADPQKIIDLIPEDIRPYVCMNLSLSCQYDKDRAVYLMPQNAMRTYRSWGSVCQKNGLWFTCQPASGGHTHLQCDDLESFEFMFKRYPNFLGWNFAEQFWGFDEDALYSAKQTDQIALFAKLVEMSHNYGGFLTVSFCGNMWSHGLSPVGMLKRNSDLMKACEKYPEAMLWLYKYTQPWCFYNSESVCFGPFVAGLSTNYGVRYDNCGWNGAMSSVLGNDSAKYPVAAGIGTVMEQTAVNGGAVWDGPELIWTEDFQETSRTTVDGYQHRNWTTFPGFNAAWIDMFRKVIDGTIYIPSREEVVGKTKIVIVNDLTSGSDEDMYASWGGLYDGLYKQTDPTNVGNGYFMDNKCYFKLSGRYGAIPVVPQLYDSLAQTIPTQVKKSQRATRWSTQGNKTYEFNRKYPKVSTGTLYVNRYRNQLVTYMPYTYLSSNKTATASIPLEYNTCSNLQLTYSMLNSGTVREYGDHIDFYMNNYRTDTTTLATQKIVVEGVAQEPSYTFTTRELAEGSVTANYDAAQQTYTLEVSHLGGVDLRVNCQGTNERTAADSLPDTALPQPVQPAAYHGPVIVEAEDMDYKNVKSSTTGPYYSHPSVKGHSGNGFVEMGTSTTASLRHHLQLDEAGIYRISVRYMSADKDGQLAASVNGKTMNVNVSKTADNEWRKVTFAVSMKEGDNDIILTNAKGVNMLIDQVTYTPRDWETETFPIYIREADHGSVVANVNEAAEGKTVVLSIMADEGYGLEALKIVNGVNFTMANTISLETLAKGNTRLTFTMPDDMVTLQPVFAQGVNVTDGIRLLNADGTEADRIYDLNGRQVSNPSHGVFIKNGKKIVVK